MKGGKAQACIAVSTILALIAIGVIVYVLVTRKKTTENFYYGPLDQFTMKAGTQIDGISIMGNGFPKTSELDCAKKCLEKSGCDSFVMTTPNASDIGADQKPMCWLAKGYKGQEHAYWGRNSYVLKK